MEERVAKAVGACYEAILAPENWADALHDLARSLDAVGCLFWPRDGGSIVVDLPISPDLNDVLADFVKGGWHLRDHRADRGWPLFENGQTVLIDHDVTGEEERSRGAFHQEWCRNWDLPGWAGVGFRVDGDQWAMPLLRSSTQGDFTPADTETLNELSPHLARMVGFAEKLTLGQACAGLSMLDQVASAAMLLDRRGNVTRLNAHAEALLGPDLKLVRGRLSASDKASDHHLRELVQRLLTRDVSLSSEVPPVLIHRFEQRPLLIEAMPVSGLFADVFHRTRALLLITDLDARPVLPECRLRQVFGLTPAEARLAAHLAGGEHLEAAADALGITTGTARSQLKSVFAKTDTHRQAELVALLGRIGRAR